MNLETLVNEIFEELRQTALEEFNASIPRSLNAKIEYNSRMRSTLGRAYYSLFKIELNQRALDKNRDAVRQTVAHELAHLISYEIYGLHGKGHGVRWKSVMIRLGFSPERCHSVDVSEFKARRTKVKAKCECKTHEISSNRATKMKNRTAFYRCGLCKTRLELF
jgi:SprT protein